MWRCRTANRQWRIVRKCEFWSTNHVSYSAYNFRYDFGKMISQWNRCRLLPKSYVEVCTANRQWRIVRNCKFWSTNHVSYSAYNFRYDFGKMISQWSRCRLLPKSYVEVSDGKSAMANRQEMLILVYKSCFVLLLQPKVRFR